VREENGRSTMELRLSEDRAAANVVEIDVDELFEKVH
jgi:hypothetical protein